MKYILVFLINFVYFFIVRPILTILYIVWYFDLPNFSAYFYFVVFIEFHEGRMYKYLVFRSPTEAFSSNGKLLYELYADEGKKYCYFSKWDINDFF